MAAVWTDATDTADASEGMPQLTIACHERSKDPSFAAAHILSVPIRRRAKVMPVNQFAHLDSTETATSSTAYREPSLPDPRSQHQPEKKAQKQKQHHLYAQQLTFQSMSVANSDLVSNPRDGLAPRTVVTKLKKTTPDGEKTEEYFQKRKRNNMAAKKSRDNRRKLEEDIRKQVCILEKKNNNLRQKIADFKESKGLHVYQSVMTAEERQQCDIEINRLMARLTRTSNYIPEGEMVTSEYVSRPDDGQVTENNTENVEEAAVSLDTGGKKMDGNHFAYGPSIYGPFIPSPCWTPVTMQPQYKTIPVHNLPNRADHSINELQENSSVPVDYFVTKGMATFMPTPYGDYMQPGIQKYPTPFTAGSDGRCYTTATPNFGIIHLKSQQERAGICMKSDPLNMRLSKNLDLSAHTTQSFVSSTQHRNYMGDAPAITSFSGQVPGQLYRHFKVPLPVHAFSYRQLGDLVPSNGQDGVKVDKIFKPEKVPLKKKPPKYVSGH